MTTVVKSEVRLDVACVDNIGIGIGRVEMPLKGQPVYWVYTFRGFVASFRD